MVEPKILFKMAAFAMLGAMKALTSEDFDGASELIEAGDRGLSFFKKPADEHKSLASELERDVLRALETEKVPSDEHEALITTLCETLKRFPPHRREIVAANLDAKLIAKGMVERAARDGLFQFCPQHFEQVTISAVTAAYQKLFAQGSFFEVIRVDALAEVLTRMESQSAAIEEIIRNGTRAEADRDRATADLKALLQSILLMDDQPSDKDIPGLLGHAHVALTQLRAGYGSLRGLENEYPQIADLLRKADEALYQPGLDELQKANRLLAEAEKRISDIQNEREEALRRDRRNRARLIEKRAEIAAVQSSFLEAADLLDEAAGLIRPETPDERAEKLRLYDRQAALLLEFGQRFGGTALQKRQAACPRRAGALAQQPGDCLLEPRGAAGR